MPFAAPALGLRVLLVGLERVLLRRIGDWAPPTECAAVFFGIGALVLLPFAHLGQARNWSLLPWAVPAGLVYALAYWFYVSALSRGEVSAIGPLGSLGGIFTVALAAAVYGEPLTSGKAAGTALIVLGATLLQRTPTRHGPRVPLIVVLQMIAYSSLTGVARMLDKAGAGSGPEAAGTYAFIVFALTGMCQLLVLACSGRLGGVTRLFARAPDVAVAAGACNGGSFLLLIVALGAVPVSVAEPITSLSLLVSAAAANIWLKEPVKARWAPTLAVLAGTWLLVHSGAQMSLRIVG